MLEPSSKANPMLMPMKAPTHVRRLAILMGVLVLGACSADVTAPAAKVAPISTQSMFVPSAAAKALIGVVDGTYSVTVDPTRDQSFNLGPNHLDIPAFGICNLAWSGYGPQFWDRSCSPQTSPIVLTVIIKNASSDHPSIDFSPAMRFNPNKTVQLFMYAPNVSVNDAKNWQMLYCPDFGSCFNESLYDSSLQTRIDYSNNVLFRRVKHFSGYTVAE
ncbi:hypothetical protein BH09GEM1_BH09GEM1_44630 [soil metagenome]